VERYANFLEKDFILRKESGRIVELEDEDILPSENTSEHSIEEESLAPIVSQEEDVIPVRRSIRTHKAPNRLCLNVEIDPDRLCFNVEVEEHSLGDLNEHANYKAALSETEFENWLVAMNAKMKSMYDNKVWRLVVLPPNAKIVKSKWIYKMKTDMDGKGYTQTYGVDYEETFSPVADIRAIRILIAIAAYYDYEIWQMDVKTAFLNGFLEEEIYMEQ
ncbi:retrotransposon protein, putative, ty1-copia subclass, partial [Tanacetum coccineum]